MENFFLKYQASYPLKGENKKPGKKRCINPSENGQKQKRKITK